MKQLGIATAIGMIVASVNIANAAGTHAQGGTLTVPIITQTFVETSTPTQVRRVIWLVELCMSLYT